MIIGIIGYSGAGKDTVAKMIQYYFFNKVKSKDSEIKLHEFLSGKDIYDSNYSWNELTEYKISEDSGWQIKKYAAKLKQIAALLVGCKHEDFESEEFKNSDLPKQFWIDGNPRTYRWFLQTVGMKMREVNENIWVDSLMVDYKENFIGNIIKAAINRKTEEKDWNLPNWIITDVRFENEVKAIKDRKGIILRVDRPSLDLTLPKYEHESEKRFQNFDYDCILCNNSDLNNLYKETYLSLKHTVEK